MIIRKSTEQQQKEEGYVSLKKSVIGDVQNEAKKYADDLEKLKMGFYKKQSLCVEFEESYDNLQKEAEDIHSPEIMDILKKCYKTLDKECKSNFISSDTLLEGTGFELKRK